MLTTNDHYRHFPNQMWQHIDPKIYVQDGNGCTWEIEIDTRSGGLRLRPIGTLIGGDQIVVLPQSGNAIAVRAEHP